ncbi:cytochrome P450 711A1 isoform X1 [Amborella trichopoda]|uniref:Cytochrome P450 n=1 Tax=Amborella trichopoda TaxID=13333 RepID=U5D4Q9_AMBTC|nr:cytochrome P450 711A1 isoform X1 [Amborella trichopoda]ERN15343.1 hypothetical protein AMTR_s00036p00136810 [Amborella trichopoda]|eukprot:XP_011626843.2 cytochrome P450 711A1 isoform X1 [Amborella trichopoda]
MAFMEGFLLPLFRVTSPYFSIRNLFERWVPLICTVIAIVVGIIYVYFSAPSWRVRAVPGHPTRWFLGHLHLLAKHGPGVFSVLAKEYGPIYRFHMGRQPLVIIADAELCREAGIKKFKDLPNRSIPSPISASPLHLKGLFFSRGSRWSIMRNTITSLYQPSHLASLIPTMHFFIASASSMLESHLQRKEDDVNFSELTLKLTTDVIGRAAFGVNFGLTGSSSAQSGQNTLKKDENSEDGYISKFLNQHIYSTTSLKMDLTGTFSIILGLFFPILQNPVRWLLCRIPGTADREHELANKELSQRVDEVVEKRCKEIEGGSSNIDLLTAVLNAQESYRAISKKIFTPECVSSLAYEHLLAGSATTSFTMAATVYLVSAHPEVEEKLLREIDTFGPPNKRPDAEDLRLNFPYLDMVVKEAMRFFTVSPLVAREAERDVQIGGYLLPKGTWIWLALGVLAKDPSNFPEPEKFKPERFDPQGEEEKKRHPYAHIPFGIGPRACVGGKFSIQEIKLTLIYLYQRYIFRHSPNMESPLEFDYGVVLNYKHGVKLRILKRSRV